MTHLSSGLRIGRNQGLDPALAISDELGQVTGPQFDLYTALEMAMSAQPNPLSIIISTQAASDQDLLSQLIDDTLAGHDPRNTCSLYAAGPELDPFSDEAIRAANPSFDFFQNQAELRALALAAQRMPSREADYRRYTLNQRITVATPFVSPTLWESCRGQLAPLTELQPLYGGLDLSAVNDLSAFVLVGRKGEQFHAHCRFWLPEEMLREKSQIDHAPYLAWRAQGYLSVTPGKAIDYDRVAMMLRDLFRTCNIAKVAYDPWNWDFFTPSLRRAGFTEQMISERFIEFAQTTKMMSPAMANLERILLDGRLVHDNPILTSCIALTTVRTDAAGNRAPDKKKGTHKIDGTVALIMGLSLAPTERQVAFDPAALIG